MKHISTYTAFQNIKCHYLFCLNRKLFFFFGKNMLEYTNTETSCNPTILLYIKNMSMLGIEYLEYLEKNLGGENIYMGPAQPYISP